MCNFGDLSNNCCISFNANQQDDKKKKKLANKAVDLPIASKTHGYSQVEFDRYFELEVSEISEVLSFDAKHN